MSVALLYAGQGSQKENMGKDLYESFSAFRNTIDGMKESEKIKKLLFHTTQEELTKTANTQPAMGAFAAGVTAVLEENGVKANAAAGLSLGEYSALHAAGVFDTDTLMQLLFFRGQVMEAAAEGVSCSMAAVLGLKRNQVEEICRKAKKEGIVEVSNYNCPGQYVIAGEKTAVSLAGKYAMEANAKRVMPLKVSGPFHTSFMKPAGDELREYFKNITFHEMQFPVIMNRTARPIEKDETIPKLLEMQVQHSVDMENTLLWMENHGVDTYIEVGPGKVLSALVRRTVKAAKVFSIESAKDMEQLLEHREEWQ